MEPAELQGFTKAWRISDGKIEATVVPEGGRIIHFSKVGSANILWVNPSGKGYGDWANYGGDKVWPWPQDRWTPQYGLQRWPPHIAFDNAPFEITRTPSGLRLVGPVAPELGFRTVRIIEIVDGKLRTHNRLEATATGAVSPHPWSVWTVTQLPWTDEIVFTGGTNWQKMSDGAGWPGFSVSSGGRRLHMPGGEGPQGKVGADGDSIVWRKGGITLTQRVLAQSPGEHRAAEQLQAFRTAKSADTARNYVEIEITSPRRVISTGDGGEGGPAELVVEWELSQP